MEAMTHARPYPRWVPSNLRLRIRTLYPYIYAPDAWFPAPATYPGWHAILAHETCHLAQQGSRLRLWAWWVWRYLLSRTYRLRCEADAIAAELAATPRPWDRSALLVLYCDELSGSSYGHCADNYTHAYAAIQLAIERRNKQYPASAIPSL